MCAQSSQSLQRFLRIEPADGQVLSGQETEFNRLMARIEGLRAEITGENAKQEALRKCAVAHLLPAQEKINQSQWLLAQCLDNAALGLGFSTRQQDEIGRCIHLMCKEVLGQDPTHAEAAAMQRRWTPEVAAQPSPSPAPSQPSPAPELDWDQLSADPEALQAYLDQLEAQQQAEAQQAQAHQKKTQAGKSKKAQLHESAALLQTKSVRQVFVGLAKQLHPDTERDPQQRDTKEGLMKEAIQAYERDDLATLLQLEMDWIHRQEALSGIPAPKLEVFLNVLEAQVKELSAQLQKLRNANKGSWLEDYAAVKLEIGIQQIKAQALMMLDYAKALRLTAEELAAEGDKRQVQAFVKDFLEMLDREDG